MCKSCEQQDEAARRPQPREQAQISRRGFMGMLLAASAAFTAASVPLAATAANQLNGAAEPETIPPVAIARVEEVPPGESRRFAFLPVAKQAILINLPGEGLKAYSEECTHLGCAVYWDKGGTQILCPCHKGVFNPADGAPVAGPPRRPLTGIALEVRDGIIYAVGRKSA